MKIELKKIQYSERLSQETNAFAADLYIDGKKAGMASNEGHGGPTDYYATNETGKQLIKDAEAYCKSLPLIKYPGGHGLKAFTIPMDLEHFIDDLLEKHLQQKEIQKFNAKLNRYMPDHILFGKPNQFFSTLRLKFPIELLLAHPNGGNILSDIVAKKILPELKDGVVLLNTNIPEKVLQQAGLTANQFVEQVNKNAAKIKVVKKYQRPGR